MARHERGRPWSCCRHVWLACFVFLLALETMVQASQTIKATPTDGETCMVVMHQGRELTFTAFTPTPQGEECTLGDGNALVVVQVDGTRQRFQPDGSSWTHAIQGSPEFQARFPNNATSQLCLINLHPACTFALSQPALLE